MNKAQQPEWMQRCLNRDRRAQHAFYHEHFAYLMRIALNFTQQRETAVEWVNMGMAKIFLNLAKYDPAMPLGTWMGKVLTNTILDELRKERRHVERTHEHDIEAFVHLAHDENSPLEIKEFNALLDRALQELPETTRVVFRMYAIEGFPHQEIADQLRIPLGTSHWHFSKARKHLQDVLNKTWTGA